MRYFRGDIKGAEQRFAQALKIEPGTLPALAYTAQIALDKKAYAKAVESANKAVEAERLSPLAHYLLAEAQEAQGQTEDARRAYADLLNTSPGFTGAMLKLAKLLAADGKAAPAQEMLVKIYFADPEDTEARAQLFKLGY
jgi:hypothetical protein